MLSDVVAEQVNRARKRHGWNRGELAKRCRKLGAPQLTEAAITNIETGRRDADGRRRREVTVDELVIFGRALGVPPVLLAFPVGSQPTVEAFPGVEAPTWGAARWFTGEAPWGAWPDESGKRTAASEQDFRTTTRAPRRLTSTGVTWRTTCPGRPRAPKSVASSAPSVRRGWARRARFELSERPCGSSASQRRMSRKSSGTSTPTSSCERRITSG